MGRMFSSVLLPLTLIGQKWWKFTIVFLGLKCPIYTPIKIGLLVLSWFFWMLPDRRCPDPDCKIQPLQDLLFLDSFKVQHPTVLVLHDDRRCTKKVLQTLHTRKVAICVIGLFSLLQREPCHNDILETCSSCKRTTCKFVCFRMPCRRCYMICTTFIVSYTRRKNAGAVWSIFLWQ